VSSQLGSELHYITQVTFIQEIKIIAVVKDSNLSTSCTTSNDYQQNKMIKKNKES
jgi:hypothetical protein